MTRDKPFGRFGDERHLERMILVGASWTTVSAVTPCRIDSGQHGKANIYECLPKRKGHGEWAPLAHKGFYEGVVMKRCSQCGGKFGLIRHAFLRAQLCSKKCLEAYKRDWEWRRGWLRLLHVEGRIASKSREHPTLVEGNSLPGHG